VKVVRRLFAIVTLLALGVLAWNLLGHQHNIANGSQIFAEVSAIRAAVPSNASNVQASSSDASWVSGCSEVPGSRSGWTTDEVSISFTDLRAKPTVTAQIATALRKLGCNDLTPRPALTRVASRIGRSTSRATTSPRRGRTRSDQAPATGLSRQVGVPRDRRARLVRSAVAGDDSAILLGTRLVLLRTRRSSAASRSKSHGSNVTTIWSRPTNDGGALPETPRDGTMNRIGEQEDSW